MAIERIFLLIALLLFSLPSHGADKYLFAPLVSYHIDRKMGDCEVNPGLAYRNFTNDNFYYHAGVFKNSGCDTAVHAFIGWESHDKKSFMGVPYGYGIMGGFTTGYDTPVTAAPYIRLGNRDAKWNVNILTIPHPTKGVFGIGVSYKLGE